RPRAMATPVTTTRSKGQHSLAVCSFFGPSCAKRLTTVGCLGRTRCYTGFFREKFCGGDRGHWITDAASALAGGRPEVVAQASFLLVPFFFGSHARCGRWASGRSRSSTRSYT